VFQTSNGEGVGGEREFDEEEEDDDDDDDNDGVLLCSAGLHSMNALCKVKNLVFMLFLSHCNICA
jgi:hypothetical protein